MKTHKDTTLVDTDRAIKAASLLSLDAIRKLSARDRAWALAEAILQATLSERLTLAPALLELATPRVSVRWTERGLAGLARFGKEAAKSNEHVCSDAIGALASCFAALPGQAQEVALVIGAGRWQASVPASVASDERATVRASLAMLAGRSGEASLLGWVQQAFGSAGSAVHAERALCLLALAGHARNQRAIMGAMVMDEQELAFASQRLPEYVGAARWRLLQDVISIVQREASNRTHPASQTLVHAVMLAMDTSLASREVRGVCERGADDAFVRALSRGLRASDAPIARLRALAWCHEGVLARACIARLASARHEQDHEAVLGAWHLALRPGRASALKSVPVRVSAAHGPRKLMSFGKGLALPGPLMLKKLTAPARAGLPLLSKVMHVQAKAREAMLEPLLVDPLPRVRHALARHCPEPLLDELVWDSDIRVARTAVLRMLESADALRERRDVSQQLRALQASPHEQIRAIAASQQPSRSIAERKDAKASMLGRDALLASIRAELASKGSGESTDDAAERQLRGLRRARARHVLRECESELLLLSTPSGKRSSKADAHTPHGAGESKVQATAVMALAWCPTSSAMGAIARCLHDQHERVRANAVEALAQWTRRCAMSGSDGPLLAPFATLGHSAATTTQAKLPAALAKNSVLPQARAIQAAALPAIAPAAAPVTAPVQWAVGYAQLVSQASRVAIEHATTTTHHRERANAALLAAMLPHSRAGDAGFGEGGVTEGETGEQRAVERPQASSQASKAISLAEPKSLEHNALAISTALSMLRDDRLMQRVAGLWLAWKLCGQRDAHVMMESRSAGTSTMLDEQRALLAASIEEVAEVDTASEVRTRAASLASWLRAGGSLQTALPIAPQTSKVGA